ncbi:peptidylprolyl isomerase [Bradyrhizobium sp.]|uniref:peptidylprolyl isomerase n=1 Tax=Bradyrhizobium sp. TaxID=376 RepID=UPI004037FCAD
MKKIRKEPLVHFLLVGAVLFGAYAWMRTPENPAANKTAKIDITAGDARWLAENWATQWRRPPTRDELRGLIADYLNEQLLAREARALGLEDNDVIIRRRLAQKLTFIIDDTMRRAEPTEEELQRYYDAHARRFRSDARISFAHIYFSPQRRADARSDAENALKLLVAEGATAWNASLGDRLLVRSELRDETEQSVSSTFGPDFARAVFALEASSWSGPVQSGYGMHLVRVSAMKEASVPPLSEIRERVTAEWKREREMEAKERYLAELRKKYDVVADEEVKALIGSQGERRDD